MTSSAKQLNKNLLLMKAMATRAKEMTNDIQVFTNESGFELAQRQAKALSGSTLIPESFQNNLPNCLIALEIAHRLQLSPFMILQSLHVIHGRPSFSASFIIAQINASGRFAEPLQFRITGEGEDRECVAWTTDKKGVIQEGPPISIKMAKAEGWYQKKGSKWQTLPDLMLRYRAAAFFGRVYTPELLLGMQTHEEVLDVQAQVIEAKPAEKPDMLDAQAEFARSAANWDKEAGYKNKGD